MASTKSWPCESVCSIWAHQTVWCHKDSRMHGGRYDGEKAAQLQVSNDGTQTRTVVGLEREEAFRWDESRKGG